MILDTCGVGESEKACLVVVYVYIVVKTYKVANRVVKRSACFMLESYVLSGRSGLHHPFLIAGPIIGDCVRFWFPSILDQRRTDSAG